jgi:alpha-tubulin suppressor-like RCC1 family protein
MSALQQMFLGTSAADPQQGLWAWGNGAGGTLGLGNITTYNSPKQVGALTDWKVVKAGNLQRSIAIKADGALWGWGLGQFGAIGLGNTTSYSSPKQVGALTNWAVVTLVGRSSLAVKTDGTLWAWGRSDQGQLGLGNLTSYSSPVQVGALTAWATVTSGGGYSTFAIKTNGTLWAWGINTNGVLGLGNITQYSSPVQVGALTNWATVSTSNNRTFATKTDGTMWAWGYGFAGALGLGNTTSYSSPKQIGALTGWSVVSSNNAGASAIKTNGTLWSWGQGSSYGQLGLGNLTDYSSPVQVGALTNWSILSCKSTSQFAIKTDGTLWTWGRNQFGQLGLSNSTNYSSPKQIGALTTWVAVSSGGDSARALKTP